MLGGILVLALAASLSSGGQAVERREGGVVRGPVTSKRIALVFTGHEFAEGAETILDALGARKIQASFFLTGVFLRDPAKAPIVTRMVHDGHYVGPHSDAHLLYAPWSGPKVSLVSRETFSDDLRKNLDALRPFGVNPAGVKYFLPSYEWYNEETVEWTRALGMTLICHTTGTRSTADYTEEGTPQFVSSDAIFRSIVDRERNDPSGLNGYILLLHVGAGPRRADKFHRRVAELIDVLARRGYDFARVDALLRDVK